MILDVKQALASYTLARQSHLSTVTALHTGAGAMQASGAVIAGVGAAMVAGFAIAVNAAAEFERKLDFFAAVSNTTQAEYEAISEKALQLGADTIFSANQIADSFIELGKSGVSARDIIDGIGEGVAALGAAADIPLDTAANIITSAVATFQLGADQAVHVADQLAGAANSSIVDVQDLGLSLKYVGGIAAALKIPFEDVNAALAILGVNGIKGSTAGTSLRQIMLGLSGTTPKATAALKELGIITEDGTNKFYDETGSAKSLADIFQILQEATAGMTDQQKVATLQQIFATRALPSLIALTREGADGFNEMAAAIEKTTALDVANKRLDNLSGDLEILRGNLDTLFVSSGSGFQEFARGTIQGLTNLIQGFLDLPKGVQTAIVGFIGFTGALLVGIGTAGFMAGSLLNIIALFIQLKDVLIIVAAKQAIWNALTALATAAQIGLDAALTANPIGIIIVAIAALIAGIILLLVYWDQVAAWIQSNPWIALIVPLTAIVVFWDELVAAFQAAVPILVDVWNTISSTAVQVFNNVVSFFQWFGKTLFDIFIQPWINAYNFVTTTWNNIIKGVATFITNVVSFFQALPAKIVAFFQALPGMIGYALGFLLGTIVRVILSIGTWIATNVPIIIGNIVKFFQELPGKIAQFFTDIWNNIITMWVAIGEWIVTNVPLIIENIITFFRELPAKIIQFFIDLFNGAVKWLTDFWNNAVIIAQNIFNGIVAWIVGLPAAIAALFQQIVKNVVKFFTDAYNNAVKIATNIFNSIKNALLGLPDLVKGIFNNVVKAIQDAIAGAVKAVTDFASGLWEGFKDGLGIHSPSYIERAMWAITDVVSDETKRMKNQVRVLQNLGNGISEVGNSLTLGTGMSDDLKALYRTVVATKDLESQLAASSAKLGVEASQSLAVTAAVDSLADGSNAGDTIYNMVVNTSEGDKITESLPRTVRTMTYLAGR